MEKTKKQLSPKRQMIRLWSISMAIVVFVAFGIMSIVMALIPMNFGIYAYDSDGNMMDGINWEQVKIVSFQSEFGYERVIYTDEPWLSDKPSYRIALEEIQRLIDGAFNTNRFMNFFFQSTSDVTLESPGTLTAGNIAANNNYQLVRIEFRTPQFSLFEFTNCDVHGAANCPTPATANCRRRGTGNFEIRHADYSPERQIMQMIIPLGNSELGMGPVTWHFSRNLRTDGATGNQFEFTMNTYGRIRPLHNYIADLRIPAPRPID